MADVEMTWASGSVVAGVIGQVTARTWEVRDDGGVDVYAAADSVDGVVAVTTIWRPGAREVEVDVLGTDPGAVQAAWESEAEEAVRRTV